MNGACQNVLPLVVVFVFLGIGCEDRGQTFRPHKVVDPSNKTNAPQFVRPARTEAIARIAELGGRTGPASPAVTSKDKRLSLRLLAPKTQRVSSKAVVLMGELKNDSKKDWVVLRPFADEPRAYMEWLAMRGPKGRVEYDMSQGVPTYQLSDYAFTLLRPGQVIRDGIELSISSFKGLDVAGEYFFTLQYSVDDAHYGAEKHRLFPDRKQELWTGELHSEELKITKSGN